MALLAIGDPDFIGVVNDESEDVVGGRPFGWDIRVVGVERPLLTVEGGHPSADVGFAVPIFSGSHPYRPLAVNGHGDDVVAGQAGVGDGVGRRDHPLGGEETQPATGGEPLVAIVVYGDVPDVVAGQVVLGVEVLDVAAIGRIPAHDAPSNPGAIQRGEVFRARAGPHGVAFDDQGLHVVAVGEGGPDALWRGGNGQGAGEGDEQGSGSKGQEQDSADQQVPGPRPPFPSILGGQGGSLFSQYGTRWQSHGQPPKQGLSADHDSPDVREMSSSSTSSPGVSVLFSTTSGADGASSLP